MSEATVVLLQYGALGAIAVFAILGVTWYGRNARKDMQRMLEINQQNHLEFQKLTRAAQTEFTDYLKHQTSQAYQTNAAFVEAIREVKQSVAEMSNRVDRWLTQNQETWP
jgi:hypothetical protein